MSRIAMEPDRVEGLLEQATKALTEGHPLRALALADQLAALNPEDATTRVLRAHALLATNSLEDGFREAQVATLLDAESEDAHLVLALAAWRMRRLPLAQQSFERAVELSGHRSDFSAQYAWFLASERPAVKAARAAERVLGQSPKHPTAWAALGLAQYRLDRSEQAEKSLRRALEIDPRNPEAQSAMIRLLKRRGEHRQAGLLSEVLDQSRKRRGFFVEGPAEFEEEKNSPTVVEPKKRDVIEGTIARQQHERWAWVISVWMIVIALVLALFPLIVRAPLLGLISLAGAIAAIGAASYFRRR